jgi:GxxExxY protein
MTENDITGNIIDCCIKIHRTLGPGLLESVYEEVLAYELKKKGLHCERQVGVPVFYDELKMDLGFRADIIVEGKVIIELKSIERFSPFTRSSF